jgi:hypothetical protein
MMNLLKEIKLKDETFLKLYSERCVKPGVGEYYALNWKYGVGAEECSVDSFTATAILAANAYEQIGKMGLKKLLGL